MIFFSRSLLPVLAKKDYFLVSILILVWLILPQAVTWADPSAVSTFHCIGVYWSPQDGSSDNVCQVHYRSHGSTVWKEALPLWYDDRGVGGYPAGYRGSIVNLDPGTVYEIKLELLNTGTEEELIAETWSEDFPIAKTVYLPAGTTNQVLRITESGSPDGYILYTHPEGESSTIDVNNQEDSCIYVGASYVSTSYIIIRGLTLKGAGVHGIRIQNNVHDVVIEECDISEWGRLQEGEWGHNNDAAVFSDSPNIERIIVQRNKLHHPRPDTNSWKESARTIPINTNHPMGPVAIVFKPRNERAGNYVIRYNEIYSDEDHYYNDCMGETKNFSYTGFPIRDTDIYGNYVANCWDDGIEVEGANCNVRIWGNYITETAIKIATQSVSVGPLYIWRNVFGISRAGPNDNVGWRAFKSGDVQGWGGGKTYIFHNTILQPPYPDRGSRHGINAQDARLTNTCTRNNILHAISSDRYSINSGSPSSTNDFDYDLYNGRLNVSEGHELNGIYGVPTYIPSSGYDRTTNKGIFELSSYSLGYDAGEVIPNFNDNFIGEAPDVGAHEAGTPPMEFGVDVWSFNVFEPGLVGLWKLDETEGAIAYDSAGLNDGTVYGEPLWQPTGGMVDGALQFDGIDDYVSADLMLDRAKAVFSVFTWIKGGMPGQVVFSQEGTSDWLGADTTNGSLMTELRFLGKASRSLQTQAVITDGNWHRIGLVWDGSNRILYVDDVEVASDTFDKGWLIGGLHIGAGKNLEPGSFFSGLIDDVRIYDRAITP